MTTWELRREAARLRAAVEATQRRTETRRGEVAKVVLTYANGDRYEGEVKICKDNTMRHGEGVHVCGNGDRYEGDWMWDKREGKGVLELGEGSVVSYRGDWREDKTHGYGICVYRNGAKYEGEFNSNVRSGQGVIQFANGDVYEGEWSKDCIHGTGRLSVKDGFYEGEFANGEIKHGRHVDLQMGIEYKGSFHDGVANGEGVMILNDEWKYKGSFVNGQKSGQGICEWISGHRYEGEWLHDLRHGKGRQTFRDALVYDGDWRKDNKHGKGMQVSASGDRYIGSFIDDRMEGEGVMMYANGDKYKGQWRENARNGNGKCLYANGDKYKGEWHDDARSGHGTCHFADGAKFTGLWKNDTWVQTAASPEKTILVGEGLHRAVAGKEAEFTIEARDEEGQRRLSGGDVFHVLLRDQKENQWFGKVKDQGNGLYTACYQLNLSGHYELYVLSGDDECVSESPYHVEIHPAGPCLKQSCLETQTLIPGRVPLDQVCEFFVTPRDIYGNACRYEDVLQSFTIDVGNWAYFHTMSFFVIVSLGIDGTYCCSFVPKASGFYRLFVASKGQQLPRSPISVFVGDKDSIQQTVIKDESLKWNSILDTEAEEVEETSDTLESKFIKDHPEIPVVTKLEDLWRLNKLQQDRKRKSVC